MSLPSHESIPHAERGQRFATTRWSIVLAAGQAVSQESTDALESLCETYWFPVYAYVRRVIVRVEDAQDLTQGFFTHLLEKGTLARANPERGRFRAFLLTALKNFLSNERHKAQAEKRGGGKGALSLDFEAGESRCHIEPSHELTPERLYERRWVLTLLDLVLDHLRLELAEQGKEQHFMRLKAALTGEMSSIDYEQAVAALGMSAAAAKQAVYRMRKRYRELFRLEVVFYELLTGELPMEKFAPPPKQVHVDVRLDEIVLRALEQEPELRYQHASEVKTDVELVGRTPVASLHADNAPKGGVFPLRFPERDSGEPRLSGHALCGASWAAVGLLAAALCVLGSFTTPTSVLGEYLHAPARVFGLLALSAPFGTTILGAIAVATIKRSSGKLYGLRLAALDLLTFPLIVLGAVTAYVTNLLAFMIEFNARGPASNSRVETFAVFGVPGVLVALVVSFFVGRLAWRKIVGGPANKQSFGSKGGTPLGVAVSPDSSSVHPQWASQRLPPIASRPLGPEQISLGAAVAGVVLPTLILIGGILLSSDFSIPDSIVPVCFLLGIGLETVAIGCGFAARGTKSGTAGLIIGLVSLVVWLATLSAITISNHEIGPQPEPTIKGFTDTSTTVDEPMALNDRSLRKEPRRQVDSAVASEPSEANAIRNSSIPAMPGQKPDLVRLERVGHIAVVGDDPFLGLAVQGQYAYLIQGNVEKPKRLHVVDLSELSQPRIVGSAPVTVQAAHLAVAGNYVYVLDEPRLRVFDVSAPAAPHDVGACELGSPLWDIAILGRFAYVTDFASVRVIDLENPTAPKQVGRCEVPDAQGITVVGQYAYIACDIEGLSILDISNPNAPVLVGRFNGPAGANAVAVAGNHACIAGGEDAVTLWIADISNPKEPKSVSKYGDWIAGSVAVQDDVLYLAGGELNILDISKPAAPTRAGSYRDVGFVTIAGENLFVLGDQGFSILRVVRTDQ